MFRVQHNRTFRLSVANNRRSKVWDTIDTDINDFLERLSHPVRGTETHAQFMALLHSIDPATGEPEPSRLGETGYD